MAVMLMLFQLLGKILHGQFFFLFAHVIGSPFKYFLCLDTMVGVFDKFAVLHHPVQVLLHPGLFFLQGRHAHIPHELLLGKLFQIVRGHFYLFFPGDFIRDQGPF